MKRNTPTVGPSPARIGRQLNSSSGRPRRDLPLTRQYEVAHLNPSGQIEHLTRMAPAAPAFEHAFSAMARGSLVSTPRGASAIEDLLPGDEVLTESGPQVIRWIGSIAIVPRAGGEPEPDLYRVFSDSFGPERPTPDLILGRHAHLLRRSTAFRSVLGSDAAFVPVAGLADGVSIAEVTPRSPVRVYQIGFAQQHVVTVNGLELESLHPGDQTEKMLSHEMRGLYMTLFPHARHLRDFGSMGVRRLDPSLLDGIRAA